jgi:hypothetical protein
MKQLDLNFNITKNINKARIDVGMSTHAPHSAMWLSKYSDMLVIGIEPNPFNYEKILDGEFLINTTYQVISNTQSVKLNNELICNFAERGNIFKPIEAAIDNVDEPCEKSFYCTSMLNTGCSSLHKPIDGSPGLNGVTTEKQVDVSVISLKHILDNFNWQQIPVIEFLKTDTQANDLNVIKSCKEYLKRICFIHSEYHTFGVYEGEKSQTECFTEFDLFMKQNNFKCYNLTGTDVSYVNLDLIEYIITNNVVNDTEEYPNGQNYL